MFPMSYKRNIWCLQLVFDTIKICYFCLAILMEVHHLKDGRRSHGGLQDDHLKTMTLRHFIFVTLHGLPVSCNQRGVRLHNARSQVSGKKESTNCASLSGACVSEICRQIRQMKKIQCSKNFDIYFSFSIEKQWQFKTDDKTRQSESIRLIMFLLIKNALAIQ